MKTIKEWLEELPTEIKEKAFYNVHRLTVFPNIILEFKEGSIKDAISSAFIWECTDEGHEYWESIYNGL